MPWDMHWGGRMGGGGGGGDPKMSPVCVDSEGAN